MYISFKGVKHPKRRGSTGGAREHGAGNQPNIYIIYRAHEACILKVYVALRRSTVGEGDTHNQLIFFGHF